MFLKKMILVPLMVLFVLSTAFAADEKDYYAELNLSSNDSFVKMYFNDTKPTETLIRVLDYLFADYLAGENRIFNTYNQFYEETKGEDFTFFSIKYPNFTAYFSLDGREEPRGFDLYYLERQLSYKGIDLEKNLNLLENDNVQNILSVFEGEYTKVLLTDENLKYVGAVDNISQINPKRLSPNRYVFFIDLIIKHPHQWDEIKLISIDFKWNDYINKWSVYSMDLYS